jgi:hypothetical protein
MNPVQPVFQDSGRKALTQYRAARPESNLDLPAVFVQGADYTMFDFFWWREGVEIGKLVMETLKRPSIFGSPRRGEALERVGAVGAQDRNGLRLRHADPDALVHVLR